MTKTNEKTKGSAAEVQVKGDGAIVCWRTSDADRAKVRAALAALGDGCEKVEIIYHLIRL